MANKAKGRHRKEERRLLAQQRTQAHAARSAIDQLALIESRPGSSERERKRLLRG